MKPAASASRTSARLEAMAQEYLAEHPVEAGDDGARVVGGCFRRESDLLERRKAELEEETDRWSYLPCVPGVQGPDAGFEDISSAKEIDAALRDLAAWRDSSYGGLPRSGRPATRGSPTRRSGSSRTFPSPRSRRGSRRRGA